MSPLRRIFLLALLMGVAACQSATLPTRAEEDAYLETLADYRCHDDKSCAVSLGAGHVRSSGDRLTLLLTNGGTKVLTGDAKDCGDGDNSHFDKCLMWRLLAHLPSRHFFLVEASVYEGGTHFLYDDRSGAETDIGWAIPAFSPDGTHFVTVGSVDQLNDDDDGIVIWRRESDRAVKEWTMLNVRGNPVFDHLAQDGYARSLVRWTAPDRIEFDFQLIPGNSFGYAPNGHWRGDLTREGTGWKLTEEKSG